MPVSDPNDNQPLFLLLFENEFHHINFDNSYSISIGDANLYLVDERIESGRDGSIFEGLSLYIQSPKNDRIVEIPCEESVLYRLNNAILNSQKPLPALVEKFMRDYLAR